jgi:hypothetical protein
VIDPLISPPLPPETDVAVSAWMRKYGWKVPGARWELEPETGFYVWEEEAPGTGRAHALWIEEAMVRHLTAEELVQVLNTERMVEEIRISFKVRIEERGAEYRVSVVSRRSGGFGRQE